MIGLRHIVLALLLGLMLPMQAHGSLLTNLDNNDIPVSPYEPHEADTTVVPPATPHAQVATQQKAASQPIHVVLRDFVSFGLAMLAIVVLLFVLVHSQKQEQRRSMEKSIASQHFKEINNELRSELSLRMQELRLAREQVQECKRTSHAFMNNVNHEIRTPLNGLIGFSRLLMQDNISPTVRADFMRNIEQQATKLTRLLDDLLTITQIETNQLDIQSEPYNLNLLIDELYREYYQSMAVKQKHLHLQMLKPLDDSEATFSIDLVKLRRIMQALIDNAIKFTSSGRIEFGYILQAPNQTLQLFVKDTGIGIHEDKQQQIFDRFYRTATSTDLLPEGLGIGLSVAQGLAHAMGGHIDIKSQPNQGTICYITLPQIQLSTNNYGYLGGRTVLLIDEQMADSQRLTKMLKQVGIKAIHIKMFDDIIITTGLLDDLDAVIMSWQLPFAQTDTVVQQLRAANPNLPIVALTTPGIVATPDPVWLGCQGLIARDASPNRMLLMLNDIFKTQNELHK